MSFDGKLLRQAQGCLADERAAEAARRDARRREVYRRLPRVAEIDAELRGTVGEIIAAAFERGTDPGPAIAVLRERNLGAQSERAALLRAAGFAPDALEEGPFCRRCNDTGFRGGVMCECLKKHYTRLQIASLSNLLGLGEESFDTFDIEYYDEHVWPERGASPRENMELIYGHCRAYARKFDGYFLKNLLFSGGTGLGKTFLSACIAREVANRGFSVVYDSAGEIFARFEAQKFDRAGEDGLAAKDETRRYLNCDLLIVDDLGAEMTTSFVQAALYTLVNTRLMGNKRTVVSTNLPMQEIRRRYSPQIASRLAGEYEEMLFFGDDIRLKKKP